MAREEQDREDLLAEAISLVERVELALPGLQEHLVAGFRRDGCASLYFGPDPAYHFNTARQLRRAFAHDLLIKAERGKLVSLQRVRAAGQVQLLRHELDDLETRKFVADLLTRALHLHHALERGDYQIVGQTPPDADIVGRFRQWLAELGDNVQIASHPRGLLRRLAISPLPIHSCQLSMAIWAIVRPILIDAVAAGDGAFSTWIIRSAGTM